MQAIVNGISLSYTDEGKGAPALVFVHGFPLCRDTWSHQVEAFRASHRVIAPDLRGLGQSEAQPGTNTMERFAQDVHALLGALGTGPVVLVGHSMGGYVALALARLHADLLRGLVLVATKAGADSAEAAAGRRATAEKVKLEGTDGLVSAMAPKMLASSNQDAAMAAQVRDFMEPSKPEGVIAALLGMAERQDSTPLLGQIQVPTLVVTGAADTVIPPSESEALAKGIAGAELQVIPDAGHLVAFERPAEFNAALGRWLERV